MSRSRRVLLTRLTALVLATAALIIIPARLTASREPAKKLDVLLQRRADLSSGYSQVIVRSADGSVHGIQSGIRGAGGTLRRSLPGQASQVAVVPNAALAALAASPAVASVSLDRVVVGAMERTSAAIGAAAVREQLGYSGAGVGVAIIDSGITGWHDDLGDGSEGQRVTRFVDLVNGRDLPYDGYGHGTHVAGIIAGNGFDSGGARTGIAPAAHLLVIKALDDAGRGRVSDVIAAIDYVIGHRNALGIRVINLSLAAGVYESVATDPLAIATSRAVKAGLVVVAAAGNQGVSAAERDQYGGVTSPGNAPWVLTVGGFSHMGTITREDDRMASFSSRGPSAIDHAAKPDLVAPAVGIESLATPNSALYVSWSDFLLPGTVATSYLPYLSLSGTSMAAPTVSGTVALMLQANSALTPNAVKAILQYTSRSYTSYDPLTQGAGFLNAKGAVELAAYLAKGPTTAYPDTSRWNRRLIWGNEQVRSGRLTAQANAWDLDVTWGDTVTERGSPIEWGNLCTSAGCEGWGAWTLASGKPRNVVWGPVCGGADCDMTWTLTAVSGTSEGDTVVWGTADDGETVVWGTAVDADTVVWGTAEDGDTVVWGTDDSGDTVVWGTSCTSTSCIPTIWR